MKKILKSLLLLATSATAAQAQDAHFSQFYETATLRNPALVGVFSGDYKIGATHRNQWSNFGTPFVTTNVSAESRIIMFRETNDYLSVGVNALFDKAGSVDFATNTFYGAVNYNKSLGESHSTFLSVGLAGGYIQRSVDVSKMRFSSQYSNGVFDQNNTTSAALLTGNVVRHFDAGAGISLNGSTGPRSNYYLGVAAYHLSKPNETFVSNEVANMYTRWNFSAGLNTLLGDATSLVLHGNYQHQGPNDQLVVGGLVRQAFFGGDESNRRRMAIAAGCFYRHKDAIIPTVRIEFARIAVTGSYDIPVKGTRFYTTGMNAFEVSLFFRGILPHRPENRMGCPRFEGLLTDGTMLD